MTTEEFIDALEQQEIIAGDLARQLRAKAADGDHRVTPEALLKFLVKTDAITRWKAEELSAALLAKPPASGEEVDILDLMPLPEIDEEGEDRPTYGATPIDASGPPPSPLGPPRRSADEESLFSSKAARLDERPPLDRLAGAGGGGAPGLYRLGGDKSKKENKKKKRTAGGKNQWDSPLLLYGGGGLVILVVAIAVLYYLLVRETSDAVLTDADTLFKNESYSQAIPRYEEFISRFSSHKDISRVRVQLEMTKLWQAVAGMGDPIAATAKAEEVIGKIEDEPAFISGGDEGLSEAKQDLSTLLVRIGKALVAEAEKSNDDAKVQELIKQIEVVLALSANSKYVPEKIRNAPELSAIEESLAVIRSRQERDSRLAATLETMTAAIAAGDTAAAYAERLTLLSEYPALADEESLAAKVLEASTAELAQVKFVADEKKAETAWPVRALVAELALAERRGASGAPASGDPVVVRVDGALFGLRSGDGALLWRRFAGLGATAAPLIVASGDVVAADLQGGDLWRLNATSGKLVWRLPLGEKIAGVIAAGPRLLATGESGKLLVVDAASGALVGHVDFKQPIHTAPAVNERGDRIYVVAEHSILYTLSGKDYSCVGVYYLGHAAGAIVAPPVTVMNKVVVADNTGTETSRIRVLSLNAEGAVAGEAASDRLTGLVLTPLSTAARRIAAATTRGQLGVFEIGGGNDKTALTVVARREPTREDPLAQFALLQGGNLWLAGRQLSNLAILPTENLLSVRSMDRDYHGDAFDSPMLAAGKLIIHVRRPAKRAGAVVAATDATASRAVWETEIAVPLAGAPAVDSPRLRFSAAAASGAMYFVDRQAMLRGVQDRALRVPGADLNAAPLTESVDLGEALLDAAAIGSPRALIVNPESPRTVQMAGPLSGALVRWRSGVLFPTDVGQVFYLDGSGESAATPFQPALTPDRKYRWLAPAVVGEGDNSQFVISDGAERLYLVDLVAEPTPHLGATKSVEVGPAPLASPLAVAGSRAFAGTEDGRLASYTLPDLAPSDPVELGGRVAWGPFNASDGLLLATDAGELMMIGGDGAIRWRRPVEHGDLGGRPLVGDGSALMLHVAGGLERINLTDGAAAGYAELGQPAIAGPVALGERVVVATPDGSVLVVNRP